MVKSLAHLIVHVEATHQRGLADGAKVQRQIPAPKALGRVPPRPSIGLGRGGTAGHRVRRMPWVAHRWSCRGRGRLSRRLAGRDERADTKGPDTAKAHYSRVAHGPRIAAGVGQQYAKRVNASAARTAKGPSEHAGDDGDGQVECEGTERRLCRQARGAPEKSLRSTPFLDTRSTER